MNLTNENLTYAEIKEQLKEHLVKNMDIFPKAQVCLQLASMVNYKSILFPIIEAVATKGIVEIGGYQGNHLKELNQLTITNSLKLHSVDPANKIAPESHNEIFSNVSFFDSKSVDYLNLNDSYQCDVFIIDGDHNYETVCSELDSILNRDCANLVILHDTSWPCAYIDTFYDKENMADKKVAKEGYMQLQKSDSEIDLPFYWPIDFDVTAELSEEGTSSKSGVKEAMDEKLKKYTDWKSQSIASIFGLTILYRERLNASVEFTQLIEHLNYMKSFLDILELNRIMLISDGYRQGIEWDRNQKEIQHLQKIQGLQQTIRENEERIKAMENENNILKSEVIKQLR